MNTSRLLVLALLVGAIGVSLVLSFSNEGDQSTVSQQSESQASTNRAIFEQSTTDIQLISTSSEQQSDCIPWSMLGQSPKAYLIDEWYSSWGAPPSFNQDLARRPYVHYSRGDLKTLSASGDPAAMHELGQSLVWSAFRDPERMPDVETLWEIGSEIYPYGTQVRSDLLKQGRDVLYRAAVSGRLYALIDISLSFAHQHAVESEAGQLSEEDLVDLQISAYAYGEAVEELIAGMPPNYFQVLAPQGMGEVAEARLADIVKGFESDRLAVGLDNETMPKVTGGALESLSVCVK